MIIIKHLKKNIKIINKKLIFKKSLKRTREKIKYLNKKLVLYLKI